jgi:hypothetical protein
MSTSMNGRVKHSIVHATDSTTTTDLNNSTISITSNIVPQLHLIILSHLGQSWRVECRHFFAGRLARIHVADISWIQDITHMRVAVSCWIIVVLQVSIDHGKVTRLAN